MVESASERLAEATTLPPARSGWLVSIPVSSTATFTPLPVSPADQAAGALTWVRLGSSSVARKRRASHTLLTPARAPVVRVAVAVVVARAAPSLAASARGWRTAGARRLDRSRPHR